jgi:hypothetical protein
LEIDEWHNKDFEDLNSSSKMEAYLKTEHQMARPRL